MIILGLAMAVLASDPDGVVTTGRATPLALDAAAVAPVAPPVAATTTSQAAQGLTTNEQIDRWISSREPEATPFARPVGPPADDREVHGYVEGGIGTGGYRAYGGGVSLPLGEDGRLDLHYRQVENDRLYGYPHYGYERPGYGLFPFGGRGAGATSFSASARWEREAADADW